MPAFSPRRSPLRATLAGALLACSALPAFAEPPPPREPVIAVTGEGNASVAPDMAILSFSVVSDDKTARGALDKNNAAMSAVLNGLKGQGIAERDLQTSGFGVNPQYVYPDQNGAEPRLPQLTGYQVANTLSVRLRDIAKVGAVIDQAVTLGVNQGGSITFTNDKPEATLTEARKKAVADAMAKARTLAEAAGVTLGRVVELSESSPRPEPVPMAMRAMAKNDAAEAVPVANGENSYSVSVTMTFAIAP